MHHQCLVVAVVVLWMQARLGLRSVAVEICCRVSRRVKNLLGTEPFITSDLTGYLSHCDTIRHSLGVTVALSW